MTVIVIKNNKYYARIFVGTLLLIAVMLLDEIVLNHYVISANFVMFLWQDEDLGSYFVQLLNTELVTQWQNVNCL